MRIPLASVIILLFLLLRLSFLVRIRGLLRRMISCRLLRRTRYGPLLRRTRRGAGMFFPAAGRKVINVENTVSVGRLSAQHDVSADARMPIIVMAADEKVFVHFDYRNVRLRHNFDTRLFNDNGGSRFR